MCVLYTTAWKHMLDVANPSPYITNEAAMTVLHVKQMLIFNLIELKNNYHETRAELVWFCAHLVNFSPGITVKSRILSIICVAEKECFSAVHWIALISHCKQGENKMYFSSFWNVPSALGEPVWLSSWSWDTMEKEAARSCPWVKVKGAQQGGDVPRSVSSL